MKTKLLNTFATASAVLLTLLGTASARAGTITVVPLPGTNTDFATGITTNKTYVSCFDYGNRNNTIYSVNGVPFAHPDMSAGNNIIYATNFVDPASGVLSVNGGQVLGGSVFLSTITNAAGNIGHIDQTSSAPPNYSSTPPYTQADGNTLNLLYDQIYPGNGQTAGDWVQEVYSNLISGGNYTLRIYWRVQSVANTNRLINFWFNGEGTPQAAPGNPVSLDTNVVTHFCGAEYIEYDFTASGTTVTMLMTNINGGQGSTTFFSTLETNGFPYEPLITYQPYAVAVGSPSVIAVQAIGTPTLSYQWYSNSTPSFTGSAMVTDGNDYTGSLTSSLTVSNLNYILDWYYVVVANSYGSVTSTISQLYPAPTIVTQPAISANVGVSVQYSVVAGGIPPLGYYWYSNSTATLSGFQPTADGNGYYSGSTTANLTASNYLAFYYALVVSNYYGFATSTPVAYNPAPAITSQPTATKTAGVVTLSIAASGWPQLAYQWYSNSTASYTGAAATMNGNDYSGTTTTNLTVTNNVTDYYSIIVTNIYGSATSQWAQAAVQLTVLSAGEPIWNRTSQTNVIVTFSDLVNPTTATALTNYFLSGGATIYSAAMDLSNSVILVTSPLSGGLPFAPGYTLTVSNVTDYPVGLKLSPTPTNIAVGLYPANLALWVRADTGVTADVNGNVSQWNDLSGNANNLSTISAIDPLLTNNAYGDTVIRFVGTNLTQMYALDAPSLRITNDMSIVAVVNFATLNGGTNGEIVGKTGGALFNIPAPYDYYVGAASALLYRGNGTSYGQNTASSGPIVGVPNIIAVTESGNTVSHFLDGQAAGTGILNNGFSETSILDQGQPLYIGLRADGVNNLTGDLSELIVAGSAISSQDIAALDNYLFAYHKVVNATPTNIGFSASSGNLTLSWPADHKGWELQAQTNSILGTWVPVSGSTAADQVIIPIDPNNGTVFYRLVFPPQ